MKHFPKARRIRQQIKRRLSTGSIEKNSSNNVSDRKPITDMDDDDDDDDNDGDNNEEYFADNESGDEDERVQQSEPHSDSELKSHQQQQEKHQLQQNLHRMYKTKSFDDNRSRAVPMERSRTIDMAEAKDLNELARTPDFQKMVYQNWKAHHRKNRTLGRGDGITRYLNMVPMHLTAIAIILIIVILETVFFITQSLFYIMMALIKMEAKKPLPTLMRISIPRMEEATTMVLTTILLTTTMKKAIMVYISIPIMT